MMMASTDSFLDFFVVADTTQPRSGLYTSLPIDHRHLKVWPSRFVAQPAVQRSLELLMLILDILKPGHEVNGTGVVLTLLLRKKTNMNDNNYSVLDI